MRSLIIFVSLFVFAQQVANAEDEYIFDISEIEKKPYSFGGYLETRSVLFWLDGDASLYNPITNLELRLKTGIIKGGNDTEYGEKQNDYRTELRARYYF